MSYWEREIEQTIFGRKGESEYDRLTIIETVWMSKNRKTEK